MWRKPLPLFFRVRRLATFTGATDLLQPYQNLQKEWTNIKTGKSSVISFLESRGITKETSDLYCLGSVRMSFLGEMKKYEVFDCVTFPFIYKRDDPAFPSNELLPDENKDDFVIERIKARSVLNKKKLRSSPVGARTNIFFGWHTVPKDAKQVIITEGEIDALTIYQETNLPSISIPNGAGSFHRDLISQLSRFDTIILFFDLDEAGFKAAKSGYERLKDMFEETKTIILIQPTIDEQLKFKNGTSKDELAGKKPNEITPPKDANDFFLQGYNLKELFFDQCNKKSTGMKMMKQSPSLENGGILKVEDFQQKIFDHLFDHEKSFSKCTFRKFPSLNQILGGFRFGEITLYSGNTGSGKSTLVSQLALDLALENRIPTLFGNLELKNESEFFNLILHQLACYQDYNNEVDLSNRDCLKSLHEVYSELKAAGLIIPMNFYRGTTLKELIDLISQCVTERKVKHIMIDNLSLIRSGTKSSTKFQDMQLSFDKLRQYSYNHGVHISLVVHPKKSLSPLLQIDSIAGSCKFTQEVNNIVFIQNSEKLKMKWLEIKKNRYFGRLGSFKLDFDKKFKCFADAGKDNEEFQRFQNFELDVLQNNISPRIDSENHNLPSFWNNESSFYEDH